MTRDEALSHQAESSAFAGQQFLEAILERDSGAISGCQILTAVLARFYCFDVALRTAQTLIKEFGNVAGVINASRERVDAVIDVKFEAWATLQLMRRFAGVVLGEPLKEGPLLNEDTAVCNYLKFVMGRDQAESCRVLYLNAENYLIRDEVHSSGSDEKTAFYPRQILKRICELEARAIIIAHNHPSGESRPSQEDRDATILLVNVLGGIGATLHDHLIIGRNSSYSFRKAGLLG